MPQWNYPGSQPYSINQCERPYDEAPDLEKGELRAPLRSSDHIRLLKVYPPRAQKHPSKHDQLEQDPNIRCDIFQVSLASVATKGRPYFATLSYVWGDLTPIRHISCDGQLFAITPNLYEALIYVRHRKRPRLLWVDNLGINQHVIQEKNEQVQRMFSIYAQSHCVSWLGVESERQDLRATLPFFQMVQLGTSHDAWLAWSAWIHRFCRTGGHVCATSDRWIPHNTNIPMGQAQRLSGLGNLSKGLVRTGNTDSEEQNHYYIQNTTGHCCPCTVL